jgi:hypothetical protein
VHTKGKKGKRDSMHTLIAYIFLFVTGAITGRTIKIYKDTKK